MCKKSLLSLMLLCFAFFGLARAQSELTVYEGTTTNNVVPAYIFYFDDFTRSQHVIPADDLAEMNGGTITSLKYYTTAGNVPYTAVSSARVYLMEVDYTTMTGLEPIENGTVVFEGYFDVVSEGEGGSLTIEFETPYTYGGGNLLVGIENTEDNGYKNISFYGTAVDGAAWGGSNGSGLEYVTGSVRNFIPQTTFTYTPGATDCEMPTAIAVSEITHEGAVVTWEGDGNTWNLRYKASTDEDYTMVNGLTETSYTFSGLNGNTNYSVGVQTVCSGSTSYFKSTSFTTLNPCAAPTDLQVSDITPSSATLTWTAGYQETSWTVKYKKSTDETWTEETVTGTPTLSLTGLEGLTTYNVQVYNCESYVSGSFTTAAAFPYSQDFTASGIPTGWTQWTGLLADVMTGTALTSSSYGWSNGTSNGVLDGNNIYANIYGSGCKKWIVTPAIPMESGARLTFDVAYTAYSGTAVNPATGGTDDKFVVLASTDNMATWTILRQWDNAGSEFVLDELTPTTLSLNFDMADYAGTYLNIAFYAESTVSNADNNIHVDNVVFELVPDCEKPTNLAVNYEGGTSATFTWTENGTATSWDLQYDTDPDFQNPTFATVNDTPTYELTGLSLATTYYVRVNAFCDAPSEYSNTISFSTDICLPENQCELTFVLTDSYGDSWNGCAIQVVDVATGIVVATMANQNLDGQTQIAETQTVTLAVCDGREIQFVWVMGSYPGEASWVILDVNGEEITSGAGSTSMATGDVLATYTVNCTVSTCRRPTDLAASEIANHSAKLSWTENGEATEWVVAYIDNTIGEVGGEGGGEMKSDEGWIEVTTTENPYTLFGLLAETEYIVKVRPVCDDANDKWSAEYTFTTDIACPAPTIASFEPTPVSATLTWISDNDNFDVWYRELTDPNNDFEASSFKNWTTIDADGDGYDWVLGSQAGGVYLATGGSLANGGHNASYDLVTSGSYSNMSGVGALTPDNYLVSPQINLGGTITFWACGQDASYVAEHFGVAVSTTVNNDPAAFTTIQEWTMEAKGTGAKMNPGTTRSGNRAQGTWYEYTVDLSEYSGRGYVAIRHFNCTDMFMLNVDDIVIEQPNYVEPEWIQETANDTTYTITGLNAETTYELQLRSNCGGEDGVSTWVYGIFTTPSACVAPYGLEATNVEATSATLNWTAFLDNYNVRYRTAAYQTTYFEDNFDETHGADWTQIDGYTNYYWSGTSNYFVMLGYDGTEATQYAISPELSDELEEGSFVYFEYRTIPADSLRTFNVGYSSTTADLDAFTWGEDVTTTANAWNYFMEVIPVGTKYIAIKHTDDYESVGFIFDNFGVYAPAVEAGEWVVVENATSPLDITGLNPETWYEWQVQGVNCDGEGGTTEWSASDYFLTPEQTTVMQTIALAEGSNYVSFYVNVTLDDLKAALLAAVNTSNPTITIKSQTQNVKYQRGRWVGQLSALDMTQMYTISVPEACEISFEGMPLDPSELTVTISNGSNWIAYPYNVSMTVSELFGSFPINTDQVKSQTQNTKYNRGRWVGQLTTLEPGQGYIYVSADANSRTFTFPTPAKAGKKSVSTATVRMPRTAELYNEISK